MFKALMSKFKESVISVLPVAVIVLIISFTPLAGLDWKEQVTFAVCSVFLIIGISLFNLGADLAMTPMGEHVGTGLTKSKKIGILISVCFVMGVLITIAEPDLSVLADQVQEVMGGKWLLIVIVGVGVGLFLLLAVLKIIFKKDLSALLMFFYMALFALAALLINSGKTDFLALSFDSGGVTTGPITVPFIMALGVGIATTIGGRNANENSFGLIAMCSIGPILAVVVLALFSKGQMSAETLAELAHYEAIEDTLSGMGITILETIKNVAIALGLVVAFFLILQFTVLKLPKKKMIQIAIGIAYTFVGLLIFLVAVEVGYMPIGFKLGQCIANFGNNIGNQGILIAFGFGIGMVVVLAEPAVHVLNKQVEEVTGGGVKKMEMLLALSLAVGVSICLSIIRMSVPKPFSILYYLIPGYLISLGLSFFVPKIYTAIAFDSGGVASGPLTSSFILPLIVGACVAINNGSPNRILTDAFGVVAMVAMTPLITIQALGFKAVTSAKVRHKITMKRILQADDEQIIYFK